MTGQYCFPGDSPEWGGPAKTSRDKQIKDKSKNSYCAQAQEG